MTDNYTQVADDYLVKLKEKFYAGDATEHSYRSALEALIEGLLPDISALNERKRVEVGAPDFVLFRKRQNPDQLELIKRIPVGFIEAKDIKRGILDETKNQQQLERYLDLGNVIHTDGLEFRFYFQRELVKTVKIAELNDAGHIVDRLDGLEDLAYYLRQTVSTAGVTIRTAKQLAIYMADRARPIRRTIVNALKQDINNDYRSDLRNQYDVFCETLIHDLSPSDFADIYAETIAYGLFAARYNDDTLETFDLREAAEKVPQTNPFLRQFFLQIAAYDKDERLNWVLNNFADLFSFTDVQKIMSTYGRTTGMNHDPVTHFYETFLGEYDAKRRKARGVYYTPRPVVQYIVRAVDKVLKEEFGLVDGLADDSTVKHTLKTEGYKKGRGTGSKVYYEKTIDIPRVQILDPATGTSTFLNETIKLIAERKKHLGSQWSSYVEDNLLPRIHGFEILMAAYSMAHMRLGLTLAESGYKPSREHPRIGVYLTNALEPASEDEPPLLAMLGLGRALTEEALAADKVKRDLPIMVVMGNPPYSVSSSNKGKFIDGLMDDYKKDLNERNIQPLSDDYIKFIRYAEHMIEKSGQGVVAMITNNSYIDGLIHRQMRKHLLETFDKIFVLDLHGNAKKREVAPDGGKDDNVFDIMQGVSVIVMVKKKQQRNSSLGELHFAEVYGKRSNKYEKLTEDISYKKLKVTEPQYFFVKKDTELQGEYDKHISVRELMPFGDAGVKTHRDNFAVADSIEELVRRLEGLRDKNEEIIKEFNLKDTRDFSIDTASFALKGVSDLSSLISPISYRLFDNRFFVNFDAVADWPRRRTMSQLLDYKNVGLAICRQQSTFDFQHVLISDRAIDMCFVSLQTKETGYLFPLYIYSPDGTREPNFDAAQLSALTRNLTVDYTPEDILDYIYAALHSPSYREKYKEFLKIDFPRVPVIESDTEFARLVPLGRELRELHLMYSVTPGDYPFMGDGSGEVEKVQYRDGNVYINSTQYFADVPEVAWNFYIGGYQPAQKWLKDRVVKKLGRSLNYKDVEHYQKIIKILLETDRIMKEIS